MDKEAILVLVVFIGIVNILTFIGTTQILSDQIDNLTVRHEVCVKHSHYGGTVFEPCTAGHKEVK